MEGAQKIVPSLLSVCGTVSWQRSWLDQHTICLLKHLTNSPQQWQLTGVCLPGTLGGCCLKGIGLHSGPAAAQRACTQQMEVRLPANDRVLSLL